MTVYDIIIAAIFFGFLLFGFFRGIIKEIFDVIGLVAGVWGAFRYAPILAPKLPISLYPQLELVIAGFIILAGCVLAAKIIAWIIKSLFIQGTLKMADRIGGAILGGAKAIILILAIVIPITFTPYAAKLEAAAKQSQVDPLKWTLSAARYIGGKLGTSLVTSVSEKVQKAIPNSGNGYKPESVYNLIVEATKKKENGLVHSEIVSNLVVDQKNYLASEENTITATQVNKILEQAAALQASGLSAQEAAQVLTDKNIKISQGQIQELIKQVQAVQMSGEKPSKDGLLSGLSDSTRAQLEYLMQNKALRHIDPVEFARQTGYNVQELVKQYGLEKLFSEFEKSR